MTDRIGAAFRAARAAGRAAFIPFFTAGDPDLESSARIALAAVRAGADLVEIGVPFSDPLADGPVIQESFARALRAGATLDGVIETIRLIREGTEVPIVLMTALNPLHRRGFAKSLDRIAASGADGLICPELTPGVGDDVEALARDRGLRLVYLTAPTSSPERLALIGARSSGFVYAISLKGVTGARESLPPDLVSYLGRVRASTRLPVAVGFGISTPEQVRLLSPHADGVIVGSALVRLIKEHAGGPEPVEDLVARRVAELVRATGRSPA